MGSYLTRYIFHAILENRPFLHSKCDKQFGLRLLRQNTRGCQIHSIHQRRSFFGFSQPRSSREPQSGRRGDHGSKHMAQLVYALEQRARPPQESILSKAYLDYVEGRLEDPGVLTQSQARFLYRTFQHLVRYPRSDARGSMALFFEMENFEDTLSMLALSEVDVDATELVGAFAKTVFQEICRRIEKVLPPFDYPSPSALRSYIAVLSQTGLTSEAIEVIESYWQSVLESEGIRPWIDVVNGLAKEGKETEISAVIERLKSLGLVVDQDALEEMVNLLADNNCMGALKTIYETSGAEPSTSSKIAAIKAALRNSMIPWATTLTESLPSTPTPEIRDAVLLLAVAQGERVGAILRKMEEMVAKNPSIESDLTIDTLNLLLEQANIMKRYELVEDYIALVGDWGLEPNAQTCITQMYSRLQSGDIDGMISLFHELEDSYPGGQVSSSVLNQLVERLCSADQNKVDNEMIFFLIDRLTDIDRRIEPSTVGALCHSLLYRGDLEAISSLLRPIVDSYSARELLQISDGFVRYISDQEQPNESAWEAYELLNMAFPTTSVQTRTNIMKLFFERKRSDLACFVFGHMRQKESSSSRPTTQTYATCLEGIAGAADAENLHLVHNMLKLDHEIRLNTRVLNGLMLGYATCEMPDHAMGIFRDILHSAEGPSEQTLAIFFRVCEVYNNGLEEATKMMEKLKALDVQIDRTAYNAYIGALGGHCELERAVEAIRHMKSKTGYPPTSFT